MKKKKKKKNVETIVTKEDFTDKILKFDKHFQTKIGCILYFAFSILYILFVFMAGYYINNLDNHYYKTGFIYYFRIVFVVVLVDIYSVYYVWRFIMFLAGRKRNSLLYNLSCWFLIVLYLILYLHTLPPRADGNTWSEKLDVIPHMILYIINHIF